MAELEEDIRSMLLRKEQVLFQAQQSRIAPGGSSITPNTIYITNQRIIYRNPRWLGLKKDYIDIYYRDINQIKLKKGIFSTEIQLSSRFQDSLIKLPAVEKSDAERIGGFIRRGMANQLPGQRISELRSGPRIIEKEAEEDPIELLEKLGKLRDSGIISESEFEMKKRELLKKI